MAAIVFPQPKQISSATPALALGEEVFVLGSRATSAGLAITTVATAASGALTSAGIIQVGACRELGMFVAYNAHASTTTGRYSIIILGSPVVTEPAATDDVWYTLCATDGSLTARPLDGALPSDMDFTATPDWGVGTFDRVNIAARAVSANSDKRRDWYPGIKVGSARWLQVLYGEMGDETNKGNLAISFVGMV